MSPHRRLAAASARATSPVPLLPCVILPRLFGTRARGPVCKQRFSRAERRRFRSPGLAVDRDEVSVVETLIQDVRFGLRMLTKNPSFSAVVIITLALGIGATSVIFSIVNAVLLQPLPYRQPDRLVTVWQSMPREHVDEVPASAPNFLDWQAASRTLDLTAYNR